MSALSFGATLSRLLKLKGWSVRELAGALDTDPSLVYRWLRGARTPALSSMYIERITALLSLTPAERQELERCQAEALRATRPRRSASRRGVSVESLIRHMPAPITRHGEQRHTSHSRPHEGVIRGRTAVLDAAIEVIERASDPATLGLGAAASTILITSQEDTASDDQDAEYGARWQHALRGAMARGWWVRHLWRLNRNVQRSVALVRAMLDLLGSGRYTPRSFTRYEPLTPPYDLLIVPGVAALYILAAENPRTLDAAILTRQPEHIALLAAHYRQLERQTRSLPRAFPLEEAAGFDDVLAESEERFRGRDFVKYGFSLVTEPAAWYRSGSPWADRPDIDLAALIAHRQRRLEAFAANVRTHPYRDICPMRAVWRLAREGISLPGHRPTHPLLPKIAPPAARREHLENVIRVLRAHDNYQLALADPSEEEIARISPRTMWEVTGNARALVNTRTLDTNDRVTEMDLMIDEPTIVAAFHHHFEQTWDRIAPQHKEKTHVIAWLSRQIELIP